MTAVETFTSREWKARSVGETTIGEVIDRLRHGTIYEDYDWLAGPAMRALQFAAELEARVMAVAAPGNAYLHEAAE